MKPFPVILAQPGPPDSIHLVPTIAHEHSRLRIDTAAKRLLQNQIEWGDREVKDGQIYQAAIATITSNISLWPWHQSDGSPNPLHWGNGKTPVLIKVGVLLLAEATRIERHIDRANEAERYVHKKELDQLFNRARDLHTMVDLLSNMDDAVQTGKFTDHTLFLPYATTY